MLHFASYEKRTEYDEETDKYISYIYYDKKDETELLIQILSFGPVIKVLGPEVFLKQVKERVKRQAELLGI
jgi:predicted DNA-binding transcriptional regulator YafY